LSRRDKFVLTLATCALQGHNDIRIYSVALVANVSIYARRFCIGII